MEQRVKVLKGPFALDLGQYFDKQFMEQVRQDTELLLSLELRGVGQALITAVEY